MQGNFYNEINSNKKLPDYSNTTSTHTHVHVHAHYGKLTK